MIPRITIFFGGSSVILSYDSGIIEAKLAHSSKTLVQNVSFQLDSGDTMALIGETGSGKTMIAMSILQLLPDNVTAVGAKQNFCGTNLTGKKQVLPLLGVELVYIPQNGLEFLNPTRTVRKHLYDSLEKLGIPSRKREAIAMEKLAEAGFLQPEAVLDQYPFQLSGGMAQRVTIAIAACSKPKLILADEPTNGLSYEAKVGFIDQLKTMFPQAAMLVITHDITVARLCDTTLVLCGGRMMEYGPSAEILAVPHHPYTKALMGALVENGMEPTPILRRTQGECPFYSRCPNAASGCRCSYRREGKTEWWCSEI